VANGAAGLFSDQVGSFGTATADGSGNWTLMTSALTETTRNQAAKTSNAIGDQRAASLDLAVEVDTTVPGIASVSTNGMGDTITAVGLGSDFTITADCDEAMNTSVDLASVAFPPRTERTRSPARRPTRSWTPTRWKSPMRIPA
jgi:hypothetical protein